MVWGPRAAARYAQAYRLFDKTGSGGITGTDLKQLAHDVGETFTMSEIEDMLNTADLNGDGASGTHALSSPHALSLRLWRDGVFDCHAALSAWQWWAARPFV